MYADRSRPLYYLARSALHHGFASNSFSAPSLLCPRLEQDAPTSPVGYRAGQGIGLVPPELAGRGLSVK
jgi:hypothetical protein